ncbi:uncharacterized protein LOC120546462 [Perca fluviatilis]|uniref:uncharacterized protein LOC120546462 n=1 Tax=Perca fluviatilis TaxID=8168 RepID=UPI001966332D|nr:uncharacterized protein LOC120546462 [Perca fluviatilis]
MDDDEKSSFISASVSSTNEVGKSLNQPEQQKIEKSDLLRTFEDLGAKDFKRFQWLLQQPEVLKDFPAIPKSRLENADRMDTVDQMFQIYSINTFKVTKIVLEKMNQNDLVLDLEKLTKTVTEPAESIAAKKIYKNRLHQIYVDRIYYTSFSRPGSYPYGQDWTGDGQEMAVGSDGSGSENSVGQWSKSGKKRKKAIQHKTDRICRFEDFEVVFIFDGLDDCRLPLDFHHTEILTDVTESTSAHDTSRGFSSKSQRPRFTP